MEFDDMKQIIKKISSSEKSESDEDGWKFIPEDILVKIFKLVSVKDILSCSEVCKRWNFVSQDSLLWKFKFQADFKVRRNIQRKPGRKS